MQLRHAQAVRLLPIVAASAMPLILGLPDDHDRSAEQMRSALYKYMLDMSSVMLKEIFCLVQGYRAHVAAYRTCATDAVYDRPISGDELVSYLRARRRMAVEHAKVIRARRQSKGMKDKLNLNGSTVVGSVVRNARLAFDKLRFPFGAALDSPVVKQFADTHRPERADTGQSPSTRWPRLPTLRVV